jgi:hypothetical protein
VAWVTHDQRRRAGGALQKHACLRSGLRRRASSAFMLDMAAHLRHAGKRTRTRVYTYSRNTALGRALAWLA